MGQGLREKSYSELKREHPRVSVVCHQGTSELEIRDYLTPNAWGTYLSLSVSRPFSHDMQVVIGYVDASISRPRRAKVSEGEELSPTESTVLRFLEANTESLRVEVRGAQARIDAEDVVEKAAIGLRKLQAFHELGPTDVGRYDPNAYNMWRDLSGVERRMLDAIQARTLEIKIKN